MEIYSKQKKIQVNYRALQTSGKIEVVGSVPSVQVYQADKGEYTAHSFPTLQCDRPVGTDCTWHGQLKADEHAVVRDHRRKTQADRID